MSEMRRIRPSLLERAAEVYDFDAALRTRAVPVEAPSVEAPSVEAPSLVVSPGGVVQPAAAMPAPFEIEPAGPPVASTRPVADPVYRRPRSAGAGVAIDRTMLAERGLLVPGAPIGSLVEEFRQVKRQLLLTARSIRASDADRSRTILVCSANAGEGKTFCAVNLAIALAAERDTQVLLVDGDIAKPDVMKRLGQDNEGPGLLDALADPAIDAEACIVPTDIPQLSLLPAGTRSNTDTELLASDRTHALIAALLAADPQRILVFDSPPALAASPASVLAGEVGQVLLVVRADRTSEGDLRDAVGQLDGCAHVQLMLNAVSFVPGGRRFGSYYEQEDAK